MNAPSMASCCQAAAIWSGGMLMIVTSPSATPACSSAPISEKCAVEPTGTAIRLPARSGMSAIPLPSWTIRLSASPITCASMNISSSTPWLAAMASGEEPSSDSATSPEAIAAITSVPEANLRHSMSQPVASSNRPSAAAACIGVGLPKWPTITVWAPAAPESASAATPAARVVLSVFVMRAFPCRFHVRHPAAAASSACGRAVPRPKRTTSEASTSSVSITSTPSATASATIENSEQATS